MILDWLGINIYTDSSLPIGIDISKDLRRIMPGHSFKTIFDVGANKGQTVERFLKMFPEAEAIHSFEPQKQVFEELQKFASPFPQVHCHHLALGREEGTVTFTPVGDSQTTSLLPSKNSQSSGEEITLTRLDTFCQQQNIPHIDLLKVDAEGMDLEVLRGAEATLKAGKVDFVYAECGFLKNRQPRGIWVPITDLADYLYDLGFTPVTVYETVLRTSTYDHIMPAYYGNILFVHGQEFRLPIVL